jgi:hypothetical protein
VCADSGVEDRTRLLITHHAFVILKPGTLLSYQIRSFDAAMEQLFHAEERSGREWRSLNAEAVGQSKIVGILRPEGSRSGIIVVE